MPAALISDEFRIRQILVNILNNAVKYTEKGSVTLRIGGSFKDNIYELCMSVKDTGKGIREEDRAHLFEAFSRADMKANANIEGTGLGLAIVKGIVDSMKGTIEVESEYGVGSEFRVTLPVEYSDREPLRNDFMEKRPLQEEISENGAFTAPDARILAVDDNHSNLSIVKLFLKRTGIVPELCSSGSRAIELCRENKYDLILLDHMMPAPDGIETLHMIKTDEASLNKDTKAVVLTANAVADSRRMYMDAGFDDYLTKPLDSTVFEHTVMEMLPKDKVIPVSASGNAGSQGEDESDEIMEFGSDQMTPFMRRYRSIEGVDLEAALLYCAGDEGFLEEIAADIASEGMERSERMKKSLAENNLKSYNIDAHTIKSNMATLGIKPFSERAKKHEYAARDNDTAFLQKDAEGFLREYVEICSKLKG